MQLSAPAQVILSGGKHVQGSPGGPASTARGHLPGGFDSAGSRRWPTGCYRGLGATGWDQGALQRLSCTRAGAMRMRLAGQKVRHVPRMQLLV